MAAAYHAVIDATHPNSLAVAGGLSLAERMLFVLSRAGLGSAHLLVPAGRASTFARLRVPSGMEVQIVEGEERIAVGAPLTLLVVAAHLVLSVATLRRFMEETMGAQRLVSARHAGAGLPLVRCSGAELSEALERVRKDKEPAEGVPLEGRDTLAVLVASRKELIAAEKALLAALGRPDDGAFTRLVDRKISLAITKRLASTSVSPTSVTLFSILCGLVAGGILAFGGYAAGVLGASLFLLSTILDGCDGELARLKFQESKLGALVDILGDNLVHIAVFGGLAAGLYRQDPSLPLHVAGAALLVGLLVAMATVYWCIFRKPPTTRQKALFDAFASREFVYLMVLFAIAGRLSWFFWLTLVGIYVFSAALLLLGRRREAPSAEHGENR